jgi:ARD/ARD' family
VIDVTPETPNLEAMLAKFRREHWHDEDEVRFIIRGRGLFHIHPRQGPLTASGSFLIMASPNCFSNLLRPLPSPNGNSTPAADASCTHPAFGFVTRIRHRLFKTLPKSRQSVLVWTAAPLASDVRCAPHPAEPPICQKLAWRRSISTGLHSRRG